MAGIVNIYIWRKSVRAHCTHSNLSTVALGTGAIGVCVGQQQLLFSQAYPDIRTADRIGMPSSA